MHFLEGGGRYLILSEQVDSQCYVLNGSPDFLWKPSEVVKEGDLLIFSWRVCDCVLV